MRRQNGITLDEVMKMDCMKKCQIIAGHRGVFNTVSKVNIMADPDALEWVDACEFLLTTAYYFKNEPLAKQKELVQRSAQRGLSALGIKIQPYLEELPMEVLETANELDFPIVELHDTLPFSEIMTPIFQEVFNKQTSLLQRIEKIHEELMNVMLRSGSIEEILQIVAEHLQNPVMLRIEGRNIWRQGGGKIDEDLWQALPENAKQFLELAEKGKDQSHFYEDQVTLVQKRIRRMTMPVVVKNRVSGFLMAWSIKTPLGGFDLSVLESAATTIALEVLRQMSIRDVENRYRVEFFEDLISMDPNRKEKALEKASLFQLTQTDYFMVLVIQGDEPSTEMSGDLFDKISWIHYETEKYFRDTSVKSLMVFKTDSLYVLLSAESEKELQQSALAYGRQILSRQPKKQAAFHFRVGIGRCYAGLDQVDQSYEDSVKALKHGPLIEEEKAAYFEDLGIYKILCHPCLEKELHQFYEKTLAPLVAYDKKKSSELLKTLETYYQQGGNLRKTAKTLYTHYNTTLYRMENIQRITGMDLNNHKDRLNLEVALKVKKLLDA